MIKHNDVKFRRVLSPIILIRMRCAHFIYYNDYDVKIPHGPEVRNN